jgi:bacillithiol biosynthesis cysteine-adding enzyme BshC
MNDLQWMNFKDLPHSEGGFSKLYTDYTTDFRKVQQYFEVDFHQTQLYPKHAERMQAHIKHRAVVAEVLLEQNKFFGCSDKTLTNAQQLANDNTFAIVTGQQVGMLGGPLYTIYKTITAIKLAKNLGALYPNLTFVPVFWLEGEDHDFEEVSRIGLLNAEHHLTTVEYLVKGAKTNKNFGPVGEIELNSSLDQFFDEIQKALPNSEFKPRLLEMIKGAYTPQATFNKAFTAWMNTLFADDGLVFVSSNDKRLKQILSPIFLKEIQEYPRVSQLIIQRSAELEEQYHAQIKTKAMNLFLISKGGRYFIEPRENDFSLKGIRQFLTKEELIAIATETPEHLSPNVALRPICQDTILPTLAYIGGPSEIAYFAQLQPVYRYFNMTMPVIYPRASATIFEEKQQRVLEKYQLELPEFFGSGDKISRKVVEMISEVKIDEMFAEAFKRTDEMINEMRFGINYIDSTLMGPLESTQEKIEAVLSQLRIKVEEAQKRRHEVALRQIQKVINSVSPNGNFQERELNIINFMNKHGFDFMKWLQSELQIDQFKHQIIRL